MTHNDNNISYAPAGEDAFNWKKRIKVDIIHKYWIDSIGVQQLEEDETIRITAPFDKDGVAVTTTSKDQIRNSIELIKFIEKTYNSSNRLEFKQGVGFSISSGVFKHRPYIPAQDGQEEVKAQAPSIDALKYVQNMVLDLDAHVVGNKERFPFNSFTDNSIRVISLLILRKLNQKLNEFDISIKLKNVYKTGGGLQFILRFNRKLLKEDATIAFGFIKNILNPRNIEERRMLVHGMTALDVESCELEFDSTSGDIIHTQRLGGTLNPKKQYNNAFALEVPDINDSDLNNQALTEYAQLIAETKSLNLKDKNEIINEIKSLPIDHKYYMERANDELDADFVINKAVLNKHKVETFAQGNQDLFNSPFDAEILKKIPNASQYEYFTKDLIRSNADSNSSSFVCPFHDDSGDSFTVWKNDGDRYNVVLAKDFHDNKVYNLIQFMMAEKNYRGVHFPARTRSDVIQELAATFNIQLTSAERKAFNNERVEGAVDELINMVNTEEFIYYRLATKSRSCIVREFNNGKTYIFDGPEIMAEHILLNQLKVHDADMELRAQFSKKFREKILVSAFEEFRPGYDRTYIVDDMLHVNLWIPSEHYRKSHEISEMFEEMNLVSSLKLIEEKLPLVWFYLNQITQRGNLAFFVNWLAANAQFKTMSTIPILTSEQGTGKGVFVTQFIKRYFNSKYVNTISSDQANNNFNAFMQTSSMLILDEGEFTSTKDVNNLKFLSGNDEIMVEKKGVDTVSVKKYFNMIMMTNGEVPLRHSALDRRMTYFRLDIPLDQSLKHLGYDTVDEFTTDLQDEIDEFWAIMIKTQLYKPWVNMNLKDNQFNKQILMMHPFGKLVMQIIENRWTDIKLQINEASQDNMVMNSNMEMINSIKTEFEKTSQIDLTLINKFIASMPYKNYTSVQQFIKVNKLHLNGIYVEAQDSTVKIRIEKSKVLELTKMPNNMGNLFEAYNEDNIDNTLGMLNDNDVHEVQEEFTGLTPHKTDDLLGLYNGAPIDPSQVPV